MKTLRVQLRGLNLIPALLVLVVMAGSVALTASVSMSFERSGHLHLTKECTGYTGLAGGFCSFTSSNIPQVKDGSKVFYDQAPGIPAGLLDSNVVLDAGNANRAVGRCTLDLATGLGLCTFSDGTGQFAGFEARVDVTCAPPKGIFCRWDGTYSFDRR